MTRVLSDRYADRMVGVLSCFERIVIPGTRPGICYAGGMTSYLYAKGIRIVDYAQFAEPLRERIVARKRWGEGSGSWGRSPRIGDVISAMEACESYRPWHDKASGKTGRRADSGKCLHYPKNGD